MQARFSIFIIILFTALVQVQSQEKPIKDIAKSCFKIIGYQDGKISKTGSGFIIKRYSMNENLHRYLCVSNAHVLDNIDSIKLLFSDNSAYTVKSFVYSNNKTDITFFKFYNTKKITDLYTPNLIMESKDFDLGSDILTITSPRGLTNSISTGIVSGIRNFENNELIQITAPISSGSSGGLLTKKNGTPIGIVVSQFTEGQNINFAIPFNTAINELISKNIINNNFQILNEQEYLLSNMPSYVIENDEELSEAWKYRNDDNIFFSKISKIDNNKLPETLLFLKQDAYSNKSNWSQVFNISFFTWNKYKSSFSSLMLLAAVNNLHENVDKDYSKFNLNSLYEISEKDELTSLIFKYVKGTTLYLSQNYQSSKSYLSSIMPSLQEISELEEDKNDIYTLTAKLLYESVYSRTLYLLSIIAFTEENYELTINYCNQGLKSNPKNKVFAELLIRCYFIKKDYTMACSTYKSFFKNRYEISDERIQNIISNFCN